MNASFFRPFGARVRAAIDTDGFRRGLYSFAASRLDSCGVTRPHSCFTAQIARDTM